MNLLGGFRRRGRGWRTIASPPVSLRGFAEASGGAHGVRTCRSRCRPSGRRPVPRWCRSRRIWPRRTDPRWRSPRAASPTPTARIPCALREALAMVSMIAMALDRETGDRLARLGDAVHDPAGPAGSMPMTTQAATLGLRRCRSACGSAGPGPRRTAAGHRRAAAPGSP